MCCGNNDSVNSLVNQGIPFFNSEIQYFLNKIVTLELLSPLDRYEQQKFTL